MRIVQTNTNISKPFSQRTAFSQQKPKTAINSGSYYRNTLEDFLSGHRKNSYGVEGMGVTGKTNCNRIIPVSKEMKQLVFNRVKDSFYKYNGMSGDNETELDNFYSKQNAYFKTLKTKDRVAASWTLQQMRVGLCNEVTQAIKQKVPSWTVGKPISHDILDEIFSDESLFGSYVNGSNTSKNQIDTFI